MGTIGGGGIGMLLIVLAVSCLTGTNPLMLLEMAEQAGPVPRERVPTAAPSGDPAAEFVAVVLADTEETWHRIFRAAGRSYEEPVLVLFEDAVHSACGAASAASGPFYCPADQKMYLDLSFFRDLDRRFGAPGDFAQAYVVAHEVGHHVQNLLGINRQVAQAQRREDRAGANALSVQLELQADCFAGVWGHHANRQGLLEAGDVDEGLAAAAAIGDDRLSGGRVSPESFTHGTSEQRALAAPGAVHRRRGRLQYLRRRYQILTRLRAETTGRPLSRRTPRRARRS
jgi:uncharacterized protein